MTQISFEIALEDLNSVFTHLLCQVIYVRNIVYEFVSIPFIGKGFLASHDLYVVSSKEKFMAAMSLLSKENGCRQRTTVQENHLLCMCSQTINHDLIIILKSPCSSYATFNGYPSKPQTYFWPQLPTAMTKSLHTRASPLKQELISNLKCTHGWVVRTTKTIATHLMRRQFATREDKHYKYTHEFVLFQ